jgi:aspartate carbamoyltransferase regulatory subunit
MKIDDLSISDGKSAIDFIENRKNERKDFLKINNMEIENDRPYNQLNKLQVKIQTATFKKIRKLGYSDE